MSGRFPVSHVHGRVTLADVAKAAGVSTAVVSYVVNNGPRNVSADSRRKVEAAISTLGYRRNSIASALVGGTTNLIGLLVPDASNLFFSELAREFEREALARGYLTMIGNTSNDSDIELKYISALSDLRAAGVFVVSVNTHADMGQDCPKVYVHSAPSDATQPCVLFDDLQGGRVATKHLLELGYEDILCLAGSSKFGPLGLRRQGWEAEMRAAGLPIKNRVHYVSANRAQAIDDVEQILTSPNPPRAIFATTDEQAIAALRAARLVGLTVPDDLAIVGFDGVAEARLGSVSITTIQLPIRELVLQAFDCLGQSELQTAVSAQRLSGQLVLGDTCGAIQPEA